MNQYFKIRNDRFNNLLIKSRDINRALRAGLKDIKEDTILYLNYPFCLNFCNFCIYKVHRYNQKDSDEFLKYYNKEISLYAKFFNDFKFKNIHIGGGTPNLAPPELLIKPLMKLADYNNLDRFIIEVFPRDDFGKYLEKLKKFNVTKIQLGVQTLNEKILYQENRKVSKKIILDCLDVLSKSDFIWSVDLMYGFKNEDIFQRDYISELDTIIDFMPKGIHLYKLRMQKTNDYYKEAEYLYAENEIYEKNIKLLSIKKKLFQCGYNEIYDEWCLGDNIEHAKISVCYNDYSGAFPDILGIGLMAKSHLRCGLIVNFKDFKTYKYLLNKDIFPIRFFHNFRKTNIYPVLNIYTGIKRIGKFDLGKFLSKSLLSEAEKNEINSLLIFLKDSRIKYKHHSGYLSIPKSQFSKCLYLIERYMGTAHLKKDPLHFKRIHEY